MSVVFLSYKNRVVCVRFIFRTNNRRIEFYLKYYMKFNRNVITPEGKAEGLKVC